MGAATAANVLRDVAIPRRSTAVAVILGIWLACVAATPASAAVFTVNTVADPAGAGCTGGTCSFRQAVEAVNAGAGTGDTINLPAGHYRLTLGDVRANLPVSIFGAGARTTILDALSADGLLYFQVGSSSSALSGVTLTGGRTGGGAGLYNEVALTVSEVAVTGNTATGATAGGISNRATATMTLDRSLVSGNSASTVGGGLYNLGALTLSNSTVTGNTADVAGSSWDGGGLYTNGPTTITNSTLAGNTASTGGGISAGSGANISFKNTIIANNMATGGGGVGNCDVDGTFASSGGNLENTDSCNFNQITDLRNTAPGLGTLLDNGGPTDTLALLGGSAAINKASGCPATDQRGVGRPQGGACDIGAYEFAPPQVTTGSTSARNTAGGTVSGSVLPNLRETSYHFDYGRTTSYGSASAGKSAGAGNVASPVSAALTGLRANAKYHYRLVATNAEGTTAGSDRTFTTARFTGATLGSRTLRVDKRGRVTLRLNCPALTAGGVCRAIGALYTPAGKLPVSLSARRKARRLARGSFTINAGKRQTKRVPLNKRGRRLSKRSRSFRARLLLTARDSAGNAKTRSYRVKVKRRR